MRNLLLQGICVYINLQPTESFFLSVPFPVCKTLIGSYLKTISIQIVCKLELGRGRKCMTAKGAGLIAPQEIFP